MKAGHQESRGLGRCRDKHKGPDRGSARIQNGADVASSFALVRGPAQATGDLGEPCLIHATEGLGVGPYLKLEDVTHQSKTRVHRESSNSRIDTALVICFPARASFRLSGKLVRRPAKTERRGG